MVVKVYLMIRIKEGLATNGRMEELEAIPEIKGVEPIKGICDLLAQVEAPIRAATVAGKVMAKEWVKDLRILKVESLYDEEQHESAMARVLEKVGKHLEKLEPAAPLGSPTPYRSSLLKEAGHK